MVAAVGHNEAYPDEVWERALFLYETEGLAEAHRDTGISKSRISTRAKAAGLSCGSADATPKAALQAFLKTVDDRQVALLSKLFQVADMATECEIEILQMREADLRSVVGARTRAIHDIQLLLGRATERAEKVADEDDRKRRLSDKMDELAARREAATS